MKLEMENRYKALIKNNAGEESIKIKRILGNIERTFLPLGSKIGKYQIIEEIDRGGMAVVYKVCQLDLNRIVALKVLPANVTINRNYVERFLSEAHSVAKLHHENIVNIHEVSMEKNIYYLAMDYIPGKNLFYYINQEKPKLVEVLEIVRQLSDALAYAHDQKILHRDLKLNNVIMRENKKPVLIDFGLAKALEDKDSNLTESGEIAGSPAYMAPERVFGKGLDARSDICSLGIMLYEMLTFTNPYLDPRSVVQTTKNVIEANPVPPRNLVPWLPVEVESIALKAMKAQPDNRYQTMREFGEDIQRYQRGEIVLARPPSNIEKFKRFINKNWNPIVITTICLMFTVLLILVISIQSEKEKSHWKLTYDESFDSPESLKKWTSFSNGLKLPVNKSNWTVSDSMLLVKGEKYSFLRLNTPITRDIKIEFDIKTYIKDFNTAGFFIGGNIPENGYRFYLHINGTELHGIKTPDSDFLFYDFNPVKFPIGSQYRVLIIKSNHCISFWLDNVLISKIYDYDPKLGENHQNIGFFINGATVAFDNLKIFHRALPRLARPTIIADRFWELGKFEKALSEYEDVLMDLPKSDISRQIKFKIIECLLKLDKTDRAERVISEIERGKITETEKAKILFHKGQIDHKKSLLVEVENKYNTLSELYPDNPVTKYVALRKIINCQSLLKLDSLAELDKKLVASAKKFPVYKHHFGRIHLNLFSFFANHDIWYNSSYISRNISYLYKNEETLLESKIIEAKIHLRKMEKSQANELLNQCLISPAKTKAKWEAWMTMAEIYEYSNNYKDAYIIYEKIFNECNKNLPTAWMARIRMGERKAHERDEKKYAYTIFKDVINGNHVFTQERLIARYYTNNISGNEFIEQMKLIRPDEYSYLIFCTRKAILEYNYSDAEKYFAAMKIYGLQNSWHQILLETLIKDLKLKITNKK
jgi:serine/threonine protein kinase